MTAAADVLTVLDQARVAEIPWHPVGEWNGVEHKVLSSHRGVVVGLLRLRPGAHESDHFHASVRHDVWVLAGKVQVGSQALEAGSFLSVPSGVVHTLKDTGTGCLLLYVFSEMT